MRHEAYRASVAIGDVQYHLAMRIPFDSVTLAAVVAELQPYVGGKVQGIRQPSDTLVSIAIYAGGAEAMFMMNCHAQFARCHFITKRPPNNPSPPTLCTALRARLDGATLLSAKQVGLDRILILTFESPLGKHQLVAELMGKHSNLILTEESGRILAAAKVIGRAKSSRPILPGMLYEPPPFEPRPSLLTAKPGDDLGQFEGVSPFLRQWIEATDGGLSVVQSAIREQVYGAFLVPGSGAYPLPPEVLGLKSFERSSLSIALEQHFDAEVLRTEIEAARTSLLGQLQRVLDARDNALKDLAQAEAAGRGAPKQQLWGELILAYGPSMPAGAAELEAWDYEGNPIRIKLDPEQDYQANATRYFEKAKKAKGRMGMVRDQIDRLSEDRAIIASLHERVKAEPRLDRLKDLHAEALERRWLNKQLNVSGKATGDRPYEGFRVRELMGPGGHSVLFGENAEANDYLTSRVAKPNDWWLHVRGQTSAHVVIPTANKPERIGREVFEFAAKVAVQNSSQKHAGYVPVDYTLKKYVRKPRGAAKGTAFYTHEKTIHVDLGK